MQNQTTIPMLESRIYSKHKLFFYKQIKKNELSKSIYDYLKKYYSFQLNIPNYSFIKQLNTINNLLHEQDCTVNLKKSFYLIDDVYKNKNTGLNDTINVILFNFFINRDYHHMIYELNNYLSFI